MCVLAPPESQIIVQINMYKQITEGVLLGILFLQLTCGKTKTMLVNSQKRKEILGLPERASEAKSLWKTVSQEAPVVVRGSSIQGFKQR